MPRAYTLQDVFASLTDNIDQALSPAINSGEVLNNLLPAQESAHLSDTTTPPTLTAQSNPTWGTGIYGRCEFQ